MKKRIIIAVTIILVGLAGIAAFAYLMSLHKAAITFSSDVSGATIYKEKGDEIKKLTASQDISLQNGNYYIIPEGEKVSKEKIIFNVQDKDVNVALDPDYSADFLKRTLATEEEAIRNAAENAFPLIAESYSIEQGSLYHHGEWFGALLIRKTEDIRDERDFYRIILHKDSNTWRVVNKPELIMSRAEFKDVPPNILTKVNQLTN